MGRIRYGLGAAMPLAIAFTTVAWAGGPEVELTDAVQTKGPLVSLAATNVTLPELAKQLTEATGSEVRFEGMASGTVTLNLKEVPAATLLSQAADKLGGRWQVVYRLSTREFPRPPALRDGKVLNLKMPDVSCQAAAMVVARMAGGRLERDGELAGQVSLIGAAIPVEEAMDSIARAAKASWRRIYTMKLDSLPQSIVARAADPSGSATDDGHKPAKPEAGPKPWSNHPSLTGQPTKLTKRDRHKPKTPVYGEGIKAMQQPTLEEIEKQQMLGLYGNFFLLDSTSRRGAAMQRFRTGLDTQLRRLEALPRNQRYLTTMMTRQNFQRLINDFANLDKDQQKEAQSLYDYAKEQLASPLLQP